MTKNRSLFRFAAAAMAAGGLLLAQGTTPAAPAPGARMTQHLDHVAAVLNLTEDQKAQVKTIFQSSFDQAKPLFTQLHDNRQAIEQLVKSGTTENFDPQLQALANTHATLTSQMTVLYAKAMAQVWNLLTPDQRQKADQLHQLLQPGFPGMMGGPGMHGQHMHPAAPTQ